MDLKRTVKRAAKRMPAMQKLARELRFRRAAAENGAVLMHPPGHYASPIPSLNDVRERATEIFVTPESIAGIDTRDDEQLVLVKEFAEFYADQPFGLAAQDGFRYYLDNPWFGHADGMMLHLMLRRFRPTRLIEVGSGFSSANILDTNDRFLDGALQATFIEPYPTRLKSLLHPDDVHRHTVIESTVQGVPLETFDVLEAGDMLFVDSSHVSKVGSDVNRLVFDVLPRLSPGVLVHFHDIGWPFEYPKEWIYDGRAWNEAYVLRAFLMYSSGFEIVLFNHYLSLFHNDVVSTALPLWGDRAGGSLWLRRTSG